VEFRLQGKGAEYYACLDREVLNESGARTGKTTSELIKALDLCETYPCRGLFVRTTRASLTETVLADWEDKILGIGHPAIGRQRRDHRSSYRFPSGAVVVLGGMDAPDRFLSMELDWFMLFQAEETANSQDWDLLLSRLSGNTIPMCPRCNILLPYRAPACHVCGSEPTSFQQATADANPSHGRHWLINRVKETLCLMCGSLAQGATACPKCASQHLGRMRHFSFRPHDNPRWYDIERHDYSGEGRHFLIGTLGRLRGVKRKRLKEHLWVSEEHQILEDYDPEIHRISGRLERDDAGSWMLHVTNKGWSKESADIMRQTPVRLEWFGAGADWGFWPDPGVLQVWGYDRFARRFRVAEVYRAKKQSEWWAEVAETLYNEFRFLYIAVDPSAPALRDAFNIRLARRGAPAIAIKAENVIRRQSPDLAGIDLMRWGLLDPQGVVRTFYLRDVTRYGIDEDLREALRPTCEEDEIQGWTFLQRRDGTLEEIPDPNAPNDGLDADRYEMGEGWGVRLAYKLKTNPYPMGSFGRVLGHAEKMAEARRKRDGG